MHIGVPKEIKTAESRVSLVPSACEKLVQQGHQVYVQNDCGLNSGFVNQEYIDAGCIMVNTLDQIYSQAELIIKVKEPQAEEYDLIHEHHTLFCYLHLAAEPKLLQVLKKSGCTAIAYEEVTDADGGLPLLEPMSIIAGKLSAQYASIYLHSHHSGRGVLVDAINNADKARVTVLGFGVSGRAAVEHFVNMGAVVSVVDKNPRKLESAKQLDQNITTLDVSSDDIEAAIIESDIVIGAVLVSGARAPVVVSEDWVKRMRTGAVIIDIAVDQGGCVETTQATTYEDPIFIKHGVIHYGVQNMPAAVPRTASQLLSNVILDSASIIASGVWKQNNYLLAGLCVENGIIV